MIPFSSGMTMPMNAVFVSGVIIGTRKIWRVISTCEAAQVSSLWVKSGLPSHGDRRAGDQNIWVIWKHRSE